MWYIQNSDERHTTAAIVAKVKAGELGPRSMVRQNPSDEWQPLCTHSELIPTELPADWKPPEVNQ